MGQGRSTGFYNNRQDIFRTEAGMVAPPVTQVIDEQVSVDVLNLSEVAWTCWGYFYISSGMGLRMVKELDLQLALGMNQRR